MSGSQSLWPPQVFSVYIWNSISHTHSKPESKTERKNTVIISRCHSHRLESRAKPDKTYTTRGGPGTGKKACLPEPLICSSTPWFQGVPWKGRWKALMEKKRVNKPQIAAGVVTPRGVIEVSCCAYVGIQESSRFHGDEASTRIYPRCIPAVLSWIPLLCLFTCYCS